MIAEHVRQMSVEEYFALEDNGEDWHEYIGGEIYPMPGGKLNHYRIVKKILVLLETLLAGTDCEAISSGMRVKAGETRFVIPDVSVVCGTPVTEADTRVLLNPILVAEVTSPSSIDYDRGTKREYYGEVVSIQAYLVIDQHRPLVEVYTRTDLGWHLQRFSALDDVVPLEALGCSLPLAEVYQGIAFDEEASSTSSEER